MLIKINSNNNSMGRRGDIISRNGRHSLTNNFNNKKYKIQVEQSYYVIVSMCLYKPEKLSR